MATADLSPIYYFLPIFSFLLVFIVVYAVLMKSKLLEQNKWANLFISFLVAIVFVLAIKPREYITNIIPAFAVMLIVAFLIFLLTGFMGGKVVDWNNPIGKILVVITLIIFLVIAFLVFSSFISPYLPGNDTNGANPDLLRITQALFSSKYLGAILLIIIAALVSWVLVKAKN